VLLQVSFDGGLEFGDDMEHAASDSVFGDHAEEAFPTRCYGRRGPASELIGSTLSVSLARGDERRGGQLVGAAEIGDHPLAHGRAVARVLDDLQ
jgi:hypothetical protein